MDEGGNSLITIFKPVERTQFKIILIFLYSYQNHIKVVYMQGMGSVIVISAEKGINEQSSNPGIVCCIHFRTNVHRKGMKVLLPISCWLNKSNGALASGGSQTRRSNTQNWKVESVGQFQILVKFVAFTFTL